MGLTQYKAVSDIQTRSCSSVAEYLLCVQKLPDSGLGIYSGRILDSWCRKRPFCAQAPGQLLSVLVDSFELDRLKVYIRQVCKFKSFIGAMFIWRKGGVKEIVYVYHRSN